MHKLNIKKFYSNSAIRRYNHVAAFAVFGLIVGAGLTFGALLIIGYFTAPVTDYKTAVVIDEIADTKSALGASNPLRMRIPSIGVDALFEEPLGVKANYEIEVPESYETVGWYKYGPSPGEIGPAVVLGHVDSYQGPAVLYSLGQVQVGEKIEIDREDGTTAVFEVERLERHPQSGFPTKEVYSDISYPGLRIITCAGTYNRGVQRYSHNLIVFAKLVE